MGTIIKFPTHRILLASAESFAARTDSDANAILERMAGNPIPVLGKRKVYRMDDTFLDLQMVLLDFHEAYMAALSNRDYCQLENITAIYADRVLDVVRQ
jgi:hypothetical protein